MNISNITAKISAQQVSLGWEDPKGYRYHIWVLPATLALVTAAGDRQIVYKRDPEGSANAQGAKRLEATSARWAPVVKFVIDYARTNDLVNKAIKEIDEAQAQKVAQDQARIVTETRGALIVEANKLPAPQALLREIRALPDASLLRLHSLIQSVR